MQGLALNRLHEKPLLSEERYEKKRKTLAMHEFDAKVRRKLLFNREVQTITKDEDFPLPTEDQGNAFLVGISGRRKSGKTFFADQCVKTLWRKEFDKIYVLSKTARYQPKYFATWKGKIIFVEEWDPRFFDAVKEEQIRKPKQKVLIFIDDMSSDMREKLYASNIDEFSFIGRHFRCSVLWLAQKITLFTPGFRQEADAFFLFREENMQELRLLHREWGFGELDDFLCQLLENTREKYSWIMLRNVGGTINIFKLPEASPSKSDPFASARPPQQGKEIFLTNRNS